MFHFNLVDSTDYSIRSNLYIASWHTTAGQNFTFAHITKRLSTRIAHLTSYQRYTTGAAESCSTVTLTFDLGTIKCRKNVIVHWFVELRRRELFIYIDSVTHTPYPPARAPCRQSRYYLRMRPLVPQGTKRFLPLVVPPVHYRSPDRSSSKAVDWF